MKNNKIRVFFWLITKKAILTWLEFLKKMIDGPTICILFKSIGKFTTHLMSLPPLCELSMLATYIFH